MSKIKTIGEQKDYVGHNILCNSDRKLSGLTLKLPVSQGQMENIICYIILTVKREQLNEFLMRM